MTDFGRSSPVVGSFAIRVIDASHYRVMPWKNGFGTTTEIAIDPPRDCVGYTKRPASCPIGPIGVRTRIAPGVPVPAAGGDVRRDQNTPLRRRRLGRLDVTAL